MPLNRQIKICQISFRVHVHNIMVILYQTAKFKYNNSVKNVVWAQTAEFNDRQYFQLYGKHAHLYMYLVNAETGFI